MIYYDHEHEQWLDSQNPSFLVFMSAKDVTEPEISFDDFETFYHYYRSKDNK